MNKISNFSLLFFVFFAKTKNLKEFCLGFS